MEFKYRIYKTPEGRWFVDIPDWDGEKDELELVGGADIMCEIIAQGEKQFKCVFSDEKIKASYTLIKTRDSEKEIGGAWYVMPTYGSIQYDLNVWLCDVTSKLFGRFPEIIYFYREHF